MINNYLKIALRNIKRSKVGSAINIFGLAIGMAACILIYLWVQDEMSFDKFHNNDENLYMVGASSLFDGAWFTYNGTPPAFGPALRNEYPEIINSARMKNGTRSLVINYGDKTYTEVVHSGDVSLLEMFSFPLLSGSVDSNSDDINIIYLTEDNARKYFGNEEAVGKTLLVDNKYNLTIAGVVQKIPENSTIQFDFFIPLELRDKMNGNPTGSTTWTNLSFVTYAMTIDNINLAEFNKKIENRIIEGNNNIEQVKPFLKSFSSFYMYGIREGGGNFGKVVEFSIIALLILLIACINFMNLSTARSQTRAKEVGVRKVVGAHRRDLILQFFGESILLSFISGIFSLVIVSLSLPMFNNIAGKSITFAELMSFDILLSILSITFVTGLISGSYPALFLSSFQPVKVIAGSFSIGSRSISLRKTLVVIQFSLSIILIICTLVVSNQLEFMRNLNIGLDKDQVMIVQMRGNAKKNYDNVKQELLANANIQNVAASQALPTGVWWNDHNWDWEGRNPATDPLITFLYADKDFLNTFKINMQEGEYFDTMESVQKNTETSNIVINKNLADIMEYDTAIDKYMRNEGEEYLIKGVVEDFNFKNLRYSIGPLIIFYDPDNFNYMYIKSNTKKLSGTISYVESVMKMFNPNDPFEYRFLDEAYDNLYRSDEQFGKLFKIFSFLAIFISCLGLFGLSAFMAEQNTKSIGIRKVLGASIPNIILLYSKEYIKWVVLANLIAWPISYFYMYAWLETFAFRIDLAASVFLVSGIAALAIALVTVSYQSVKSAVSDPVESLRYE